MEVFPKRCLEMRLKPCHVFLQHYHKSLLTVALLLHASGTNTKTWLVGEMRIYPTETPSLSGLQIAGHSIQCVKLKYLCTALKATWMGADSALKDAFSLIPGMLELFYHANVIWYCAWHQWTCAKYTEANKLTCLLHWHWAREIRSIDHVLHDFLLTLPLKMVA